jgi:predicted transcriptional regulator
MWVELATVVAVSLGAALFGMARRDKTSAQQAAKHPARNALLRVIQRMPGKRLRDLWRASGLARGTVEHHIRVLERAALVKARRSGGEVRFFPADLEPRVVESWSAVLYGRNRELSALMIEHPDWCQKDFTDRLGIPRKEFRRYLRRLAQADLVQERRDRYRMRYQPSERLREILPRVQESCRAPQEPCEEVDQHGTDVI